ncbi:hypothetical protein H7H73_23245 [Mycobacterium rufum]|uniref:Uncharacterized protein n=1 Tax=Mycolicibacterium rufum TaxID=318424 RepID=A0A9X3BQS2_9MYCO|nr:hypothetical protein [Mycolicibacterium rufum]
MGDRDDGGDGRAGGLQDADRLGGGGPGGDDVVDEHDGAADGADQPDPAGDVGLPVGAGQADRVAGEGLEAQRGA